MTEFLLEALFWFWAIFIFVGAIGGWMLLAALLFRADKLERDHARKDILWAGKQESQGRRV